jgi:hypothetical protein
MPAWATRFSAFCMTVAGSELIAVASPGKLGSVNVAVGWPGP